MFYGLAHMIGALAVEGAARHAGAWFSGQLWHEEFSNMGPANSALWFSLDSFGPPLTLIGLIILWMDRRGIVPPQFVAWTLGAWTLVDGIILLLTPWPILMAANLLLLAGIRRAKSAANASGTRS
jgi:hypothetical protein